MVRAILGNVSDYYTYKHFTIDDVLTFCSAFSKLSAIAGNEQLKQVPVQRIRRDQRSRSKANNRWIRLANRKEEADSNTVETEPAESVRLASCPGC